MKRRTLIGAAGLTAALGLGTPIAYAQPRRLRFGHLHPVDSPIHTGLVKAAEALQRSTQGRLTIDLFPSSQLGSAREMQTQLIDGTLDFIIESAAAMANFHRPLSLLEAPFIARDWGHLTRMYQSGFAVREFAELRKKHGIVRTGLWYYGVRHFTTSKKALRTAADVKGLKLRVPEVPLYLDMVRSLGASPTPMSLAEVYLSLQTGVVDGQENPLPTIFNNKFFEVQKFLNLTGHITLALMPLTNSKLWDRLPETDRAALVDAFDRGATSNDALTRGQEQRLISDFKARGVEVVESDRESFRLVMETMYPKYESVWGLGAWQAMKLLK